MSALASLPPDIVKVPGDDDSPRWTVVGHVQHGAFDLVVNKRGLTDLFGLATGSANFISTLTPLMDVQRGFRSMVSRHYKVKRKGSYTIILHSFSDDRVARYFICSLAPAEYRVADNGKRLEWLDVSIINESWLVRPRLEPEYRDRLMMKKAGIR
jgi:hypothetical protein